MNRARWLVTLRQISQTSGLILKDNIPVEVLANNEEEAKTNAMNLVNDFYGRGNNTPSIPQKGQFADPLGPYPYSFVPGARTRIISVKRLP